ncbi:cytochrome c oxidase assembly factor Coa1 family protein [Lysobacter sp. 1R34A]|uniref:cytochrome c oxidase assembly factor Coa1 family protein n=1 Tax=Lysobacter sp. 1R34A TaxID=3445786 RepID=UPI003EEB3848
MNDDRPNPGWWSRNWKWAVPSGCLTLVLLAGLLLVGVIGLGIKGLSGVMKASEPYRHAIVLAEGNAEVVAALGTPLRTGSMIQGTLTTENANGRADLSVPLTGPKGEATLYIKGEREADRWTYSLLEVAIQGSGQRIDLLDEQAAPREPTTPATPAEPPRSEPQGDPDPEAAPGDNAERVNAAAAAGRGRT